jgi:hypothetical protein
MEVVKKTDDYTIVKKRSGRYGVKGNNKKWINGNDKIQILVDAGLIKAAVKAEAPAEPEADEAPAEAEAEAPAEE